ncbi:immunoglobulin-like domain-containing protein [Natronosalvus amylolyticus]|uniref:immunoglobulin-like domain-containing protein n=1 Tax=Natronosalvus amylolyticus TaxID=2961994 RepID=UPI0020C9833F|nr:immunoglobulin-like domain-containing protein [Natronosalvus amylolyticus]
MHAPTRRDLLRLGALGATGAVAGCLANGDDPGAGNGDDDDNSDDNADPTLEPESVETVHFATRTDRPAWDEEAVGTAALAGSEARLSAVTPIEAVSDDHLEETLGPFIEETDFETSILLFVESGGPDLCWNDLGITDVGLEDGGDHLTATATVHDTREANEACGQAMIYPSTLTRITVDGDLPTTAAVTITDGWDETETVETSVDISVDPDDLEGYVRPDEDPDIVPASLECDGENVTRMDARETVDWGENDRFAMRIDRLEAERGETVTVTMTNVTNDERVTGNDRKFGLEVYTDEGWQDVRVYDGEHEYGPGYTDEGYIHPPGEGFEWSLELSTDEFETGHDMLEVCPDLVAGRYRFVYWPTDLAVAFDLRG